MKNRGSNPNLELSLRALIHPATLVSIFLLIINDHILKYTFPSFITGKLSDFAGLFFFPFLLIFILSFPAKKLDLSPRKTAGNAFGITLVWFTLMKTMPLVNQLTERLSSFLTSHPTQIILDPTDLIALVSLWFGWRLWVHLEENPSPVYSKKAAYVMIAVAALACLATWDEGGERPIYRIVESDGILYASDDGRSITRSVDEGRTWRLFKDDFPEMEEVINQEVILPKTICAENPPTICYKISGGDFIEKSTDNGMTWEIIWQISPGRRYFMERAEELHWDDNEIEFDVYDLIIYNTKGGHKLFAAMGYEGVLIISPDGTFERYSALGSIPTPTRVEKYDDFRVIGIEALIGFLLSISFYYWSSKQYLGTFHNRDIKVYRKLIFIFLILLSLFILINAFSPFVANTPYFPFEFFFAVFVLPAYLLFSNFPIYNAINLFIFFFFWILGSYFTIWNKSLQILEDPQPAKRIYTKIILFTFAIYIAGLLPFALWALGIIDAYPVALGISIPLVIMLLVFGVREVRKFKSISLEGE